jgi:hypothetical protein
MSRLQEKNHCSRAKAEREKKRVKIPKEERWKKLGGVGK